MTGTREIETAGPFFMTQPWRGGNSYEYVSFVESGGAQFLVTPAGCRVKIDLPAALDRLQHERNNLRKIIRHARTVGRSALPPTHLRDCANKYRGAKRHVIEIRKTLAQVADAKARRIAAGQEAA
jgi:hypothetical protein